MTALSAVDSRLVGLEQGPGEHELSFEIVPHLCRGDGALYGGTALAASLAAMELVSGRPARRGERRGGQWQDLHIIG